MLHDVVCLRRKRTRNCCSHYIVYVLRIVFKQTLDANLCFYDLITLRNYHFYFLSTKSSEIYSPLKWQISSTQIGRNWCIETTEIVSISMKLRIAFKLVACWIFPLLANFGLVDAAEEFLRFDLLWRFKHCCCHAASCSGMLERSYNNDVYDICFDSTIIASLWLPSSESSRISTKLYPLNHVQHFYLHCAPQNIMIML